MATFHQEHQTVHGPQNNAEHIYIQTQTTPATDQQLHAALDLLAADIRRGHFGEQAPQVIVEVDEARTAAAAGDRATAASKLDTILKIAGPASGVASAATSIITAISSVL